MNSTHPWESFDADLEAHTTAASDEAKRELEDALALQMVSIRLQKSLVQNLKLIAEYHDIGYQPLIRDLLNRFVKSELKFIVSEISRKQEEFKKVEEMSSEPPSFAPVDEFLERQSRERRCA